DAMNGDTIVFAIPGSGPQVITLGSALTVPNAITIDATTQGAAVELRLSGTGYRHITATAALTLKGLTFTGPGSGTAGGGVSTASSITLTDCIFTDNTAIGTLGSSNGGAINAIGSVSVTGCTFTGNTASNGGAIYNSGDTISVTDSAFEDNNTSAGSGGAIYNYGANLSINNSTFKNNNANNGDGGGAIYNTGNTFCVVDSTFTDNAANSSSGGAINTAGNNSRVTDTAFEGNTAANGTGGAIYNYYSDSDNFSVGTCTFTDNSATNGGAFYNDYSANFSITHSAFKDNRATGGSGGAVYSYSDNFNADNAVFESNEAVSDGGAVYLAGTAALTDCALINNTANSGGGIYAAAGFTAVNSSFIGNTAGNTASGAIDVNGDAYLFQCTAADNTGNGIYIRAGCTAYLYNGIVAGNTADQMAGPGAPAGGSNLIEGACIPGSATDTVTRAAVFGANALTADNVLPVLNSGIASGAATAVTDLSDTSLNAAQQAAVLAALANDQLGAPRATDAGAAVTYGAVEGFPLTGAAVSPDSTVTTAFTAGDTLDLTGTILTLTYADGSTEEIPYDAPGVTVDTSAVDMGTAGTYEIVFTYFGKTATLSITVNGNPPTTGPTTSTTGNSNPPVTGDNSDVVLWLAIAGAAVIILGFGLVTMRSGKRNFRRNS
ncbi:MAG: bacterial Ig-like domain-containing protein, partial [Oscillospiraceae bacterium]|nr:bacterial Ig-like domain-containing protein [Oscillospiraceae bacterium]